MECAAEHAIRPSCSVERQTIGMCCRTSYTTIVFYGETDNWNVLQYMLYGHRVLWRDRQLECAAEHAIRPSCSMERPTIGMFCSTRYTTIVFCREADNWNVLQNMLYGHRVLWRGRQLECAAEHAIRPSCSMERQTIGMCCRTCYTAIVFYGETDNWNVLQDMLYGHRVLWRDRQLECDAVHAIRPSCSVERQTIGMCCSTRYTAIVFYGETDNWNVLQNMLYGHRVLWRDRQLECAAEHAIRPSCSMERQTIGMCCRTCYTAIVFCGETDNWNVMQYMLYGHRVLWRDRQLECAAVHAIRPSCSVERQTIGMCCRTCYTAIVFYGETDN